MSSTQDEAIATITRDQLRDAVVELHSLADKLNEFRLGDTDAWTDEDTLAGYSLLTIIQSHVRISRHLRTTETRRDTVVHLADHR